jgi:hypothetical protein
MSKFVYTIFLLLLINGSSNNLNAQAPKTQKGFLHFLENQVSVLAGLNIAKQNISLGDFSSRLNYNLADYQNNSYKAGYFLGFRVDSKKDVKDKFDFSVSFNKVNTGTNYKDAPSLAPFLGSFSKFKADDNFFLLNVNTHFKKAIFSASTKEKKWYLIVGPSVDIRLSSQSDDNQINTIYRRCILKADLGIEFDNQSYYTLFIHYKQPLTSFTIKPISTNLNVFEIGTVFKINDLF